MATFRTLDDLERLNEATDNPIEKRRILTALLRASTAILHNASKKPACQEGLARAPRPPEGGEHADQAEPSFVLAYHYLSLSEPAAASRQLENVVARLPNDQLSLLCAGLRKAAISLMTRGSLSAPGRPTTKLT